MENEKPVSHQAAFLPIVGLQISESKTLLKKRG